MFYVYMMRYKRWLTIMNFAGSEKFMIVNPSGPECRYAGPTKLLAANYAYRDTLIRTP